jgi:hypothetical protein
LPEARSHQGGVCKELKLSDGGAEDHGESGDATDNAIVDARECFETVAELAKRISIDQARKVLSPLEPTMLGGSDGKPWHHGFVIDATAQAVIGTFAKTNLTDSNDKEVLAARLDQSVKATLMQKRPQVLS